MRRAANACMNIGAHGTVTLTKNVDLALYCKAFFLDVACCLDLHVVRCLFVVFSVSPERHFWFQPRATSNRTWRVYRRGLHLAQAHCKSLVVEVLACTSETPAPGYTYHDVITDFFSFETKEKHKHIRTLGMRLRGEYCERKAT